MTAKRLYTWTDVKRELNVTNHKIDFSAADGFDWDNAVIIEDMRRHYGERRFLAYSNIGQRLHVLVYTTRGEATHIISLRKANDREIRRHAKDS